jgi:hypothetical protein
VIVGLQREDYTNKSGDDKYKFNIVGFCDPITKQTYEEKVNSKEAKFITYEIVPVDNRGKSYGSAPTTSFAPSSFGGAKPKDDDLPF